MAEDGYTHGGTVEFLNCVFEANENDVAGGGGFIDTAAVTLRSCIFQSNTATMNGGGLFVRGGTIIIQDCTFSGNEAISGKGGGAKLQNTQAEIIGCTLSANDADGAGGGLHVVADGILFTVQNTMFGGNTAGQDGAGLCVTGGTVTLDGCTFDDNVTMGGDGGGAMLADVQADVIGCTVARNAVNIGGLGAGLYVAGGTTQLTVQKTIIAYNLYGDAIACDEEEPAVQLSCCDVWENSGEDWGGCLEGQYPGNDNLREDPAFCDLAEGDLTLRVDSPCLPGNPPVGCGLIGAWPIGCPTQGVENPEDAASMLRLGPCIPNPSTDLTEITYQVLRLDAGSRLRLSIFDPTGRLIRRLPAAPPGPGRYSVSWDATDGKGIQVLGGVYFCCLRLGDEQHTRRILVMR